METGRAFARAEHPPLYLGCGQFSLCVCNEEIMQQIGSQNKYASLFVAYVFKINARSYSATVK
jgi:hypothetical protein